MVSPRLMAACRVVCVVVALGLTATAGRAADWHVWKDKTGKFSVSAKLVSVADGKATLEKADGSKLVIPLAKLSAADQAFAAAEQAKLGGDDNPFEAAPAKPGTPPADASAPPAAGGPRELTPDLSNTRQVGLATAPDGWAVTVGPAPAPALGADPVLLPAKADFFEALKGFVVSPRATRAVVGYTLTKPGVGEKTTTRLVAVDLAGGKRTGLGVTAGAFAPVALADDGRILVKRDDFGFGNADRVEVWTADAGGIRRGAGWAPFGDLQGIDRDVVWAAFVGAGRVAVLGNSGRLTVFDGATAAPAYSLQTAARSTPAVSPDGVYLAFATDKEVGLLDLAAGKVAALQGVPPAAFGQGVGLAFSPSGRRLARVTPGAIMVYDAATGKPAKDVAVPPGVASFGKAPPAMPTEDAVLIDGTTVIDLDSQIKLWEYRGADAARPAGNLCWFVTGGNGQSPAAVVPARVPPAGAKQALAAAMADPTFFVLKPGSGVKLNCDKISDAHRAKAEAGLTARLTAAGFKVDPAAPVELTASTEVGKEQEIEYRTFGALPRFGRGGRPEGDKYTYREYFSRVKLVAGGQTVWEAGTGNAPSMFLRLKEGETVAEYLKKLEKPNYAFFDVVEIPKLVTRPGPNGPGAALGVSQVTAAGAR